VLSHHTHTYTHIHTHTQHTHTYTHTRTQTHTYTHITHRIIFRSRADNTRFAFIRLSFTCNTLSNRSHSANRNACRACFKSYIIHHTSYIIHHTSYTHHHTHTHITSHTHHTHIHIHSTHLCILCGMRIISSICIQFFHNFRQLLYDSFNLSCV